MDGVTTFLESSTMHGLGYIPRTRKYARLFWILTVLAGFSTAGYLIQQSFQSWAESPVKTTVETLPISEITFPKITVCPPRNTFTDLNYDLMAIENVSLADPITELDTNTTVEYEYDIFGIPVSFNEVKVKTKNDELLDFATEVINDHLYFDDWLKMEEKDRFYNWYYGYTQISDPKFEVKNFKLRHTINTWATSGVMSTQHFGEKFNNLLVNQFTQFDINIFTPDSFRNNKGNSTLHIYLERTPFRFENKNIQYSLSADGRIIGDEQTVVHLKLKSTPSPFLIHYLFNGNNKDFGDTELMPGFRVRWWYTGEEVVPVKYFINDKKTKNLRR